ncbi:MAG: YkgJ family cysteine cluster protein [Thermodesulfobacteriota bacterium]
MAEAMTAHVAGSRCRRCGICCRKGGPGLHLEDRVLVETGRIPLEQLYTIRAGETVYDNVREKFHRTSHDIIKIKSRPSRFECIWLNPAGNGCDHYDDRPLECRVLNCRDTHEIEAVYARKRLVREDLVGEVQGLWSLIRDHQDRCDPRQVELRIRAVDPSLQSSLKSHHDPSGLHSRPDSFFGDSESMAELNLILQYDLHLREVLTEDGRMHSNGLEFLLGRPLYKILRPLGIDIRLKNGRLVWMTTSRKGEEPPC